MNQYIINYRYKGKTYSFDLHAETREECEGRLAAIRRSGEFEGEVFYSEDIDLDDFEWDLLANTIGELND